MDCCAAVLVKMDFTNFPVSITLQQQHFLYLRYDGFDNQILYCLPNMNMVDVHAFHVTPKSFQTPTNRSVTFN